MKTLIRLLLILLTIGVFLWNYQIFSFKYGFVKSYQLSDEQTSILEEVSFYASVDEISYYKPIATPFETLIIFKSKSEGSRIYKITEDDVKVISGLVALANIPRNPDIEMKKITTVPWFVYLGIIVLLIFIPLGSKKKKK